MFSIFNSKSKDLTRSKYLPEGEPPPKKLQTEGDILVKELSKNQLKTKISLTEQLAKNNKFTASETFSEVTAHIIGKTNLDEFKSNVVKVGKTNELISKGLNQQDIKLFEEFTTLGPELFWENHRDAQKEVLKERIDEILKVGNASVKNKSQISCSPIRASTSRHEEEYLNAVKPQSIESKLLRFATENKSNPHVHLQGPMDYLPELDKQLKEEITCSKCDLKKIRKKARSLGNQIKELDANIEFKTEPASNKAKLDRKTLWDVKEVPEKILPVIKEPKEFSCKPETWYSIKDGQIVKLNKDFTIPQTKLTLEEIKDIPKFANYDPGEPSNKLFLKNLSNAVTTEVVRGLLRHFDPQEIKVLSGRMKGQAFIEFKNEKQATEALQILNGVLVKEKPIIAQFGKKT